ncbi:MAG: PEP-CTERM sorting domain-containing protein [Planctomycetota bacterium]
MKLSTRMGWTGLTIAASLAVTATTQAAMISLDFVKITNNNVEDLSDQLGATFYDSTGAFNAFGINIAANEILLAVTNDVGINSNIAEVYIDQDGLIDSQTGVLQLGGTVNFSGGGANPPNLPGANNATPPFNATPSLSADVNPGPPTNGVNAASDILGLVYELDGGLDFSDVIADLNSGELRVGYHIRSIGTADDSDSYVGFIPEPGTLALLAAGAMVMLRRPRQA